MATPGKSSATTATEPYEVIQSAYGLTDDPMRSWGLFISHGIKADEPAPFNEPGLFLISPDQTVYHESILSMPVGRPRLDDLLAQSTTGRPVVTLREAKPSG